MIDKVAFTVRAGVFVSFSLFVAWATGCNGQTSTGFAQDEGGSGSSGGAGGSNGASSGSAGTAPSAANAEGGIACGLLGGCATSESCCYAAAGAGGLPAQQQCTAQGSCAGSALDCSSSAHCSGGKVCCFAFAATDGGAMGGGAFPGFAPAQGFSAQCADQCPTGDNVHYQLCATAADCPSGQSCVRGTYTTYCAAMNARGGFPGSDAGMGMGVFDAGSD